MTEQISSVATMLVLHGGNAFERHLVRRLFEAESISEAI